MSKRSATMWAAMVNELEASGLSVSDFAARRGVTARTLTWWRWKLRQDDPCGHAPTFVEVEADEVETRALRLRFDRLLGVELEIPQGFDPDLLRAVVGALC